MRGTSDIINGVILGIVPDLDEETRTRVHDIVVGYFNDHPTAVLYRFDSTVNDIVAVWDGVPVCPVLELVRLVQGGEVSFQ
jgi:hypothetical protein